MRWRFADLELDDSNGTLSRRGRQIPIQPKAFELLLYLVRNPARVIGKSELLERVWPEAYVGDAALLSAVRKVRQAIGDDGRTQRIIRTLPKRGVRWSIEVERIEEPAAPARAPESAVPDGLRDRDAASPALAVLPFRNLAGNDSEPFLAEGFTEELRVNLSWFDGLRVVGAHSSQHAGPDPAEAVELLRQTGARFLLSGTVRRSDESLRVTAQLTEALAGQLLWADRFESALDGGGPFAAQEQISRTVAARIADHHGVVFRRLYAEIQRHHARQYSTVEAILLFHYNQLTHTPESHETAKSALQAAVEAEPEYALVLAMLSELEADGVGVRGESDPSTLERARRYAERAIALDSTCQQAFWALAYVEFLSRNREAFFIAAERTLARNPNHPYLTGLIGWCRSLMGDWDEGLRLLDRGIELNPLCPGWFHLAHFLHRYRADDYSGALDAAERVGLPHLVLEWAIRIAALHRLGRRTEARSGALRLLEIEPEAESVVESRLAALVHDQGLASRVAADVQSALADARSAEPGLAR